MKVLTLSAVVLLLTTGLAVSQENARKGGENANSESAANDAAAAQAQIDRARQRELDSKYKDALERIDRPNTHKPADPWATVR